jgi:hypothetical protein
MPRLSHYRHWSGTFFGVFAVAMTLTPLNVHSQVQPDIPVSERPSMDEPAARTASPDGGSGPAARGPGAPTGPVQDSQRHRPPAEEFDDPFVRLETKVKDEPPHPLAVAYPNHNVIVCVAGCGVNTPAIVYIAPRNSTTEGQASAPPAALALISTTPEPIKIASASSVIECIAGCYDRRR